MSDAGAFQSMPGDRGPAAQGARSANLGSANLEPRREEALAYLRRHIHEGDLTLEEYGVRVERVLLAQTPNDIIASVDGLPALHDPLTKPVYATDGNFQPSTSPASGVKVDKSQNTARSRTVFSLFSEGKLKGRWRAGNSVSVLAAFGSATIDLREAVLTADELVITGLVAFGSLQIIVPPGSNVDVDSLVVFGSRSQDNDDDEPLPGMQVIRVATTVMFGDVQIKVRTKDDTKRRRLRR